MRISNNAGDLAFTPATGQRLQWSALPCHIRAEREDRLGSPVTEALTQPGGFSPGVAAKLRLRDGRRVFVKVVGSLPNPESPAMHRREAALAAALPASVPTPPFLWAYDDGDWVALVFEDVEGHNPTTPWRSDELQRVLEAIGELAASLTPSPIAVMTIARRMRDQFQGWRALYAAVASGDPVAGVPAWARRHLQQLAALESNWEAASVGQTLVHFDLRADNLLITSDRVLVVDWPHAALGAAWLDLLAILPSIAMQGGTSPWEIFEVHPVAQGAPDDSVTAVLAALTGYFVQRSLLPSPPGLPTLRAFQRDPGLPALEWLKRRTGWR